MDAQKGNIFEILNGNKQFVIPVYQRFYSWEKSNVKDFGTILWICKRKENQDILSVLL